MKIKGSIAIITLLVASLLVGLPFAAAQTETYCIDFESYSEYDTVDTITTPAGPVNFYMTDYTLLGSLSIGDYAALVPTGDLPTVAAPNTKTSTYANIVAFTVIVGSDPYVDDWVKSDPYGTNAGGNTLTDTPDYSQTLLQQHANSMFQAILVDMSQVQGLTGVSFAGVDLDWGETWYIYYFDSNNVLIDIQTVDATPYGQSMDGYAIPISNSNPDIAKFVIWGSMNIGTAGRVGFAIDNICLEYELIQETGDICGVKFLDWNQNGVMDGDDVLLEGWHVTLYDSEGNMVAETWTDANGYYCFTGLPAGEYVVEEDQPSGWVPTLPPSVSVTISGSGGASAMETFVAPIYAAQDNYVGYLTLSFDGDCITATYQAVDDYWFSETQLYIGDVPPGSAPGSYPFKDTGLNTQTQTYVVCLEDLGWTEWPETVYVAAHCVVNGETWNEGDGPTETGWALPPEIIHWQQGWGGYFTLELTGEIQEEPGPVEVNFANWPLPPSIDVTKTGPDVTHEGHEITYTVTVTNTGYFTLYDVVVTDQVALDAPHWTETIPVLAPDETVTLYIPYTVPPTDYSVEPPYYDPLINKVDAHGEDQWGRTAYDAADWMVDVLHPAISIEKTADTGHGDYDTYAHEGDLVTYTVVVTNTGDTELYQVMVMDSLSGVIGDQVESMNPDGILEVGETWTYTYTWTVGPEYDPLDNTVTVNAHDIINDEHSQVSDEDSWSIDILHPEIDVTKTGPEYGLPGDTIQYTITVTNTGDAYLYDVLVNDATLGFTWTGELDVGATMTWTIEYTIPDDGTVSVKLVNTVTAEGHDIIDGPAYDEDSWTIMTMGARTIGYWKTHPELWTDWTPAETSIFYGKTQVELLSYFPGTNADFKNMNMLLQLRAQLLATELNIHYFDADFDYSRYSPDIFGVVNQAESILGGLPSDLAAYWNSLTKSQQNALKQQIEPLKNALDKFNNIGDGIFEYYGTLIP